MLKGISLSSPFRALPERPFEHGGASCLLGRRRTVIYGRNGSGKTTLSEVLRLASAGEAAEGATVTAAIRRNGTNSRVTLDGSTSFPWRVFVYNRYYVQESLAFFLDGTAGSPTILKIGAANVAAAQKLSETRAHISVVRGRGDALALLRKALESERDALERQTKADIIAALSASDPAVYNTTRFQVTHAKSQLLDESRTQLSDEELKRNETIAAEPAMEAARLPPPPPKVGANVKNMINDELLSLEVESQTLPDLAQDLGLSAWVEAGLQLHHAGDSCRFCKNGTVHAETLDSYRRHFSEALKALRQRLHDAIAYLDRVSKEVLDWQDSLPDATALLVDFRPDYAAKREALEIEIASLSAQISTARDRVAARLADPLVPLPEDLLLQDDFTSLDLSQLHEVLDTNALACGEQGTRKRSAQSAVEGHFGAYYGNEYRQLVKRLDRLDRSEVAVTRRETALTTAASELEQAQDDTSRMAIEINADVRDHFGHGHLRISVSDDGKGYVVLRGTKAARRLSEGERNAIAFAYFLKSLEADGVDPAQSLVVIDDPMTSMDKESLFAGFSLAEERTRNFAQVIVLTHDYEYLRLQLRQRANERKSSEKKIREGNTEEAAFPAVSALEMVATIDPATGSRVSSLRAMPRSLLRHPSEYHYLFLRVGESVMVSDPETLPLLGNAARRLLEGFISFRAPHGDDFQQKVDSIKAAAGIDVVLAGRVVKFLHGMSHREEPRPSSALDFPSIERELRSALDFMQRADQKHFEDMCKAVELDYAALSAALAAPSASAP